MSARFVKKSLLAASLVLLVLAFAGPGSALAVSGVSLSGDAGQAQYPPPPRGQGETLDEQPEQGAAPTGDQGAGPGGGGGEAAPTGAGGDQELPFTGFLAGAVLLTGAAMLAGGFALRRVRSA
jgi:hypothetical protein